MLRQRARADCLRNGEGYNAALVFCDCRKWLSIEAARAGSCRACDPNVAPPTALERVVDRNRWPIQTIRCGIASKVAPASLSRQVRGVLDNGRAVPHAKTAS